MISSQRNCGICTWSTMPEKYVDPADMLSQAGSTTALPAYNPRQEEGVIALFFRCWLKACSVEKDTCSQMQTRQSSLT